MMVFDPSRYRPSTAIWERKKERTRFVKSPYFQAPVDYTPNSLCFIVYKGLIYIDFGRTYYNQVYQYNTKISYLNQNGNSVIIQFTI